MRDRSGSGLIVAGTIVSFVGLVISPSPRACWSAPAGAPWFYADGLGFRLDALWPTEDLGAEHLASEGRSGAARAELTAADRSR